MPLTDKQKHWLTNTLLVILLTALAALVQRWVGVPVEVPPPPVTVVVEPAPGTADPPTVTVVR